MKSDYCVEFTVTLEATLTNMTSSRPVPFTVDAAGRSRGAGRPRHDLPVAGEGLDRFGAGRQLRFGHAADENLFLGHDDLLPGNLNDRIVRGTLRHDPDGEPTLFV